MEDDLLNDLLTAVDQQCAAPHTAYVARTALWAGLLARRSPGRSRVVPGRNHGYHDADQKGI